MEKKSEKFKGNLVDLIETKRKSSFQLYKLALNKSNFSKKRSFILFTFFLIFFVIIYFFVFPKTSAIKVISSISTDLNTIIIPMFAVIITGYAIFQALANENTIKMLLTVKHKNSSSKFVEFNLYFYGISISYLIVIVINFCLTMLFKYLPADFYIPFLPVWVNEITSSFLISIYIAINLNLLIELKSFIYNLFQVFFTNGSVSAMDYYKELVESEKKEEEN